MFVFGILCLVITGILIGYSLVTYPSRLISVFNTSINLIVLTIVLTSFLTGGILFIFYGQKENIELYPKQENTQKILIEELPHEKGYQFTFISVLGDTTYTNVFSKEDANKIKNIINKTIK